MYCPFLQAMTSCFWWWHLSDTISKTQELGKQYDYSWNVDHLRPKSDFKNEDDSYFFGNYEPMHRLNNEEKKDAYPHFTIEGKSYTVVRDGYGGYGIQNSEGKRIDRKAQKGIYYK